MVCHAQEADGQAVEGQAVAEALRVIVIPQVKLYLAARIGRQSLYGHAIGMKAIAKATALAASLVAADAAAATFAAAAAALAVSAP